MMPNASPWYYAGHPRTVVTGDRSDDSAHSSDDYLTIRLSGFDISIFHSIPRRPKCLVQDLQAEIQFSLGDGQRRRQPKHRAHAG